MTIAHSSMHGNTTKVSIEQYEDNYDRVNITQSVTERNYKSKMENKGCALNIHVSQNITEGFMTEHGVLSLP